MHLSASGSYTEPRRPVNSDQFSVRVRRWGALDILEVEHVDHGLTREQAEAIVARQFETLCPADRAEITIERGR